jgi:hypothetical protein
MNAAQPWLLLAAPCLSRSLAQHGPLLSALQRCQGTKTIACPSYPRIRRRIRPPDSVVAGASSSDPLNLHPPFSPILFDSGCESWCVVYFLRPLRSIRPQSIQCDCFFRTFQHHPPSTDRPKTAILSPHHERAHSADPPGRRRILEGQVTARGFLFASGTRQTLVWSTTDIQAGLPVGACLLLRHAYDCCPLKHRPVAPAVWPFGNCVSAVGSRAMDCMT